MARPVARSGRSLHLSEARAREPRRVDPCKCRSLERRPVAGGVTARFWRDPMWRGLGQDNGGPVDGTPKECARQLLASGMSAPLVGMAEVTGAAKRARGPNQQPPWFRSPAASPRRKFSARRLSSQPRGHSTPPSEPTAPDALAPAGDGPSPIGPRRTIGVALRPPRMRSAAVAGSYRTGRGPEPARLRWWH